jgi:hypothetical protein
MDYKHQPNNFSERECAMPCDPEIQDLRSRFQTTPSRPLAQLDG